MDLALPPMPFSAVFEPVQGQTALIIPEEMRNEGPGGKDRRVTLPPGVVQVIISWRGTDPLNIRHFPGASSGYETVASIPAASSPEDRSTGVLTFSSAESHQVQVIHAGGGQWSQSTLDNGYVVGVQVMPMGTPADVTGGGSMLRVDDSVGTRVFLGDQMIHGDTGWRDIGNSGDAEWDFSGHGRFGIALRRVGDVVTVWVAGHFQTSSTARTLFSIPDGFLHYSPISSNRAYAHAGLVEIGGKAYKLGAGGNGRDYYLQGTPLVFSDSIVQEFSWTTGQSWPSTLPGTPL